MRFGATHVRRLSALGLHHIHLVGYSEGGWIAIAAALHAPGERRHPPPEKTMAKFSGWLAPGVELSDLELRGGNCPQVVSTTTAVAEALTDDDLRSIAIQPLSSSPTTPPCSIPTRPPPEPRP